MVMTSTSKFLSILATIKFTTHLKKEQFASRAQIESHTMLCVWLLLLLSRPVDLADSMNLMRELAINVLFLARFV